jgi:hypothetical protein
MPENKKQQLLQRRTNSNWQPIHVFFLQLTTSAIATQYL